MHILQIYGKGTYSDDILEAPDRACHVLAGWCYRRHDDAHDIAARDDFLVTYGLYMPARKYTPGGNGDSGLGMWTNEFDNRSTQEGETFNLFFNFPLGEG